MKKDFKVHKYDSDESSFLIFHVARCSTHLQRSQPFRFSCQRRCLIINSFEHSQNAFIPFRPSPVLRRELLVLTLQCFNY